MAKVNIKSEKITPFVGIYYASKAFYALSLDKVINGTLGVRNSTYNGYLSCRYAYAHNKNSKEYTERLCLLI